MCSDRTVDGMTDIICSRKLTYLCDVDVTVSVERPEYMGDYGSFRCRYSIIGIGDEKIRYAFGVDSIQALILALKGAGTDLYTSDEWESGQLQWADGDVPGDLDFPVPDVISDIPPRRVPST
jgi:hypothetical protein